MLQWGSLKPYADTRIAAAATERMEPGMKGGTRGAGIIIISSDDHPTITKSLSQYVAATCGH